MAAKHYVALLRGINVGGKNKVPMAELRAAVEADGHTAVTTYIASGNVLFESTVPPKELEDRLEAALERHFGIPLVVVVRSHQQLRAVVAKAPAGFGTRPDTYHSDAVFLKAPLTAKQAMGVVQCKEGVDQAWPGTGVVYFARLSEKRAQSRMGTIIGTPEYQLMTIRSWTTVTKVLQLLDDRAG
ncbi:MAG: DUF1697 domain-containing protein [Actinomycetota bacterium]|nr:DUF1697 domain-containing protein [Actinomycetota bacterium]